MWIEFSRRLIWQLFLIYFHKKLHKNVNVLSFFFLPRSWKETSDCYERLMTSCKNEGEAETLRYYERVQERMDIYSQTCLPGESTGNGTFTFRSSFILGRKRKRRRFQMGSERPKRQRSKKNIWCWRILIWARFKAHLHQALAWCIYKSKQFIQNDIANDSVNEPLDLTWKS